MNKKKLLWGVAFIIIAACSIYAVSTAGRDISFGDFVDFVSRASLPWVMGAAACMFGFIWFEGHAVVRISRVLGYPTKMSRGTVYGAADVYFSAITPSATGGQPACAWFMLQDGMSMTAVTTALLINLIMYSLALLTVGVICGLTNIPMFLQFSVLSKIMILVGSAVMIGLTVMFWLMLTHAEIWSSIYDRFIHLQERLHLTSHGDEKREKLKHTLEDYRRCADLLSGHPRMLAEVYALNLLQRISQLGVTFMIFRAMGRGWGEALKGFCLQSFVALGSNCVPIPGGMGAADYLLLDGLQNMPGCPASVMEIACRGMAFYLCVTISAIIVLICYLLEIRKRKS